MNEISVQGQIFAAFGVYFCILLAIGILAHKKNTNEADFVIGNRGLNYWVTALSAHASDTSSWLFMAFPMVVFSEGMPSAWLAFGLLLGMFLSWQFVAPALRQATEKLKCFTLSSFFEKRFDDKSGVLRTVTAIMTLVFMLHYLSAGLTAMGFIFESLFHIDYHFGITVATIIMTIYTFYGGFITIAWTDFFQGSFLLIVLMIVPVIAFFHVDGVSSITTAAATQGKSLSLLPEISMKAVLKIVFLVFGWGLGYFGQPHIITKFMGIKNANELYKSKILGMSWQFLTLAGAAGVGIVGIAMFNNGLANEELVFVEMVSVLFHPFLKGLVLCAILAATISTMDSQILVCSGVLTEDLYKLIKKKPVDSKTLLNVSRLSVLLTAGIAYVISSNQNQTVMEAVRYSWTGLGCSFGPLVVMSLCCKKTHKWGAAAGILVGGSIAAFWDTFKLQLWDVSIPAMIPGFILPVGVIYLISRKKMV